MMALTHIFAVIIPLILPFSSCCTNPEVASKSFSTLDATIVSNIAYISEFSVKCGSGQVEALYAEVDGYITPVSIVDRNKYQVSWTEENKSAKSGERIIRIFDEDGFTTYRKVIRSGEDISSVPALFTVSVNHPGAYTGPWLKSEFIATVFTLIIAYFAIMSRSQVVS